MNQQAIKGSRISVIERLLPMPEVFDLGMFVMASGLDKESAKVNLSRWASKGYIEMAGPKAGIYYRRLAATMGASEQIEAAVRMLYPSATICGPSVLHRAGWTTQIPQQLHVAIETRPSVAQLFNVVLYERPIEWFRAIHQNRGFEAEVGIQPSGLPAGLRALKPAWALADMYSARDGWVPDDDDLDIPESVAVDRELARAKEVLSPEAECAPAAPRPRSRARP